MTILVALAQAMVFLMMAPLMSGAVRRLRAHWQGRAGPPVAQPYYDVWKLVRKSALTRQRAPREGARTWAQAAPLAVAWCYAAAAFGFPFFAPPLVRCDLITLAALLGMATFLGTLGGSATGSSFGGLGGSRTMYFHSLVELTLFALFGALQIRWGSTDLMMIVAEHQKSAGHLVDPGNLLLALAICLAGLTMAHRAPLDNLETELELTMAQAGTSFEYGGPNLALLEWSDSLRLVLVMSVVSNLFFPVGIPQQVDWTALAAMLFWVVKLALLALVLAWWESRRGRLRMSNVQDPNVQAVFFIVLAILYILVVPEAGSSGKP